MEGKDIFKDILLICQSLTHNYSENIYFFMGGGGYTYILKYICKDKTPKIGRFFTEDP